MIRMHEEWIEVDEGIHVWMGRMGNPSGPAVLLVHGAIENSKIFYSNKGKGLAPFLAEHGYDVFVVDLRGKGKSTPSARTKLVRGGQYEIIYHDLPLIVKEIQKLKDVNCPIHIMAHSWGGVLVASFLARFIKQFKNIKSLVFIASKRKIYVQHPKRWLMVDAVWSLLGMVATRSKGYLPAKKLRMGSDDEPAAFYYQCNKWVYSNSWIDSIDNFNYLEAFKTIQLPPVLSLTGVNDHSLGNIKCVSKMLNEMNVKDAKSIVLGRKNGQMHNYGHIDILTHPDAPLDHFQIILNWLNQHN